jgi:hypothetical protein
MPDNRYENTPRPGQEHFVAPPEDVRVGVVDAVDTSEAPSSLWGDAWRDMRHRPLFWASAALIVFVILMATVPSLFTSTSPTECHLEDSLGGPAAGHVFGFDKQGCDIYARAIYGARASVTVGLLSTVFVVVLGTIIGSVAGYFGGWLDTLLSRFTDIFFAVPFVLAAIVVMSLMQDQRVHHRGEGARDGPAGDPGQARAAQRRRADHRVRDGGPRHVHRGGGDAELPRYRPAHVHGLVGRRPREGADLHPGGPGDHDLPGDRARTDRPQLHHDGRCGP